MSTAPDRRKRTAQPALERSSFQYDVWIPVNHPLTGKRVNVKATKWDRYLSEDEVADLEGHFACAARRNTADDYYGASED